MNHVLSTDTTPSSIDTNLQQKLDDTLKTVLTNNKIKGKVTERTLNCGDLEEVSVKISYKNNK